jgi:hypothetical protein
MGEPLTSVRVFDQTIHENQYWLSVDIKQNGDVQVYGNDAGPTVRERWFDADEFTYMFTVPAKEKDAMLLHLLKERYRDRDFELTIWLRGHEIGFELSNSFSFK